MYFEEENRQMNGRPGRCAIKWIDRILQILFVLLLVFYVLSKNGIEVRMGNHSINLSPFFISVFLNLLLIRLIAFTFKICGVVLEPFDKSVILLAVTGAFIVTCFCVATRRHAYYWDETEAYTMYFRIKELFDSNTAEGIQKLIAIVRTDFKGSLTTCFMIVPFMFVDQTQNSWCISIFFNIIPGLSFAYALFLKSILKKYLNIQSKAFFALNFMCVFSMPLLYTFIFGFNESFSLVFCLLICSLVLNLSLNKKEYGKWLLIGIFTFLMGVNREFYFIWGLSFFGCYFLFNIINMVFQKEYQKLKKWLCQVISIGICICGTGMILLWPFIENRLNAQGTGQDNSFWRVGGYLSEIQWQCGYLGNWLAVYMLFGLAAGFIRKKSRLLTMFIVGHGISTLLIFHVMVTLRAIEHSTVLVPFYMMCIALATSMMLQYVKIKMAYTAVCRLLMYLCLFNMIFSLAGGSQFTSIFSSISLAMGYDQVEQIKMVSDWLTDQCEKGEKAYFIPHGSPYNPDKFRQINMPDDTMIDIMPYGSAVLGYHPFPVTLFHAKYVLTSEPFCEYSIAGKYNDAFFEYFRIRPKFEKIKEFDMKDGYRILVYERKINVDMEEIIFYRDYFKEENEKYPALYGSIFDEYIKECGFRQE